MADRKEIAKRVADWSREVRDRAPTSEQVRELRGIVNELETATPGADSYVEIDDFFATIGRGIAGAQRRLDVESYRYINKLEADGAYGLPSLFRIPKVSAEISFAMEANQQRGFDILVFSSSSSRRESQQHKVSFDVVSAPLPPEMQGALPPGEAARTALLGRLLVVDVSLRERVRKAMESASSGSSDKLHELSRVAVFRRCLVLRYDAGAGDRLLVVYANEGGAPDGKDVIDLVELEVGADGALSIPARGVVKQPSPRKPLFDFLHVMGADQETLLKELGT